jgi:hypothetical protein
MEKLEHFMLQCEIKIGVDGLGCAGFGDKLPRGHFAAREAIELS